MRGDLDDASAGRLRDALDRQAHLLRRIGQLVESEPLTVHASLRDGQFVDLRVDLPATDRNVDKPDN